MSSQRLLSTGRTVVTSLLSVLVITAFVGLLPPTASAETCPNSLLRVGPSANLPDCRAYEMVTPMIKGDDSAIGAAEGNPYGFPDGDHVAYASLLPLPGARSGGLENILSSRTSSGWVNTPLAPPASKGEPIGLTSGGSNNTIDEVAFTSDFSAAFLNSPFDTDPLDEDGVVDVYRADLASGAWSLAALPDSGPLTSGYDPPLAEYSGTFIAGVSNDAGHLLFQSSDHLPVAAGTPADTNTEFGDELYDRTEGRTYLVGVLPNGSVPVCGAVLGDGAKSIIGQGQYIYGAVSPEGSNVVFKTGYAGCAASGQEQPGLYLREDNKTTIELTGQAYAGRSADGLKIFTEGGTYGAAEGVYEYDVATHNTATVSTEGWFVASSADGSRVYYLIAHGPNAGLYLWENGVTRVIPGAGEGFVSASRANGGEDVEANVAVATPDGSKLLFLDTADLTGYDNFGPLCKEGMSSHLARPSKCSEAYVYDATTDSVTCVSCNPTGAPPLGEAYLMGHEQNNTLLPPYSEGEISPNGSRVFFETSDPLVPQDTNGIEDVYEWENGRIYLISSGQGTFGTTFSGASSNGDDVFLTTTDHLAPQDIESSTEIYDARVDGGFPYAPFVSGCDSGQCQGPQTPAPSFQAPASATFVGLGNPAAPVAVKPTVKTKTEPKQKPKPKGKAKGKSKKRRGKKAAGRAGTTNGKRKRRK